MIPVKRLVMSQPIPDKLIRNLGRAPLVLVPRKTVGKRTLTPLMRQTLELVAEGHTNAEIGERLHYSAEGVKDHVQRLLAYYDARNRTHLVTRAFRCGDLNP